MLMALLCIAFHEASSSPVCAPGCSCSQRNPSEANSSLCRCKYPIFCSTSALTDAVNVQTCGSMQPRPDRQSQGGNRGKHSRHSRGEAVSSSPEGATRQRRKTGASPQDLRQASEVIEDPNSYLPPAEPTLPSARSSSLPPAQARGVQMRGKPFPMLVEHERSRTSSLSPQPSGTRLHALKSPLMHGASAIAAAPPRRHSASPPPALHTPRDAPRGRAQDEEQLSSEARRVAEMIINQQRAARRGPAAMPLASAMAGRSNKLKQSRSGVRKVTFSSPPGGQTSTHGLPPVAVEKQPAASDSVPPGPLHRGVERMRGASAPQRGPVARQDSSTQSMATARSDVNTVKESSYRDIGAGLDSIASTALASVTHSLPMAGSAAPSAHGASGATVPSLRNMAGGASVATAVNFAPDTAVVDSLSVYASDRIDTTTLPEATEQLGDTQLVDETDGGVRIWRQPLDCAPGAPAAQVKAAHAVGKAAAGSAAAVHELEQQGKARGERWDVDAGPVPQWPSDTLERLRRANRGLAPPGVFSFATTTQPERQTAVAKGHPGLGELDGRDDVSIELDSQRTQDTQLLQGPSRSDAELSTMISRGASLAPSGTGALHGERSWQQPLGPIRKDKPPPPPVPPPTWKQPPGLPVAQQGLPAAHKPTSLASVAPALSRMQTARSIGVRDSVEVPGGEERPRGLAGYLAPLRTISAAADKLTRHVSIFGTAKNKRHKGVDIFAKSSSLPTEPSVPSWRGQAPVAEEDVALVLELKCALPLPSTWHPANAPLDAAYSVALLVLWWVLRCAGAVQPLAICGSDGRRHRQRSCCAGRCGRRG